MTTTKTVIARIDKDLIRNASLVLRTVGIRETVTEALKVVLHSSVTPGVTPQTQSVTPNSVTPKKYGVRSIRLRPGQQTVSIKKHPYIDNYYYCQGCGAECKHTDTICAECNDILTKTI